MKPQFWQGNRQKKLEQENADLRKAVATLTKQVLVGPAPDWFESQQVIVVAVGSKSVDMRVGGQLKTVQVGQGFTVTMYGRS